MDALLEQLRNPGREAELAIVVLALGGLALIAGHLTASCGRAESTCGQAQSTCQQAVDLLHRVPGL